MSNEPHFCRYHICHCILQPSKQIPNIFIIIFSCIHNQVYLVISVIITLQYNILCMAYGSTHRDSWYIFSLQKKIKIKSSKAKFVRFFFFVLFSSSVFPCDIKTSFTKFKDPLCVLSALAVCAGWCYSICLTILCVGHTYKIYKCCVCTGAQYFKVYTKAEYNKYNVPSTKFLLVISTSNKLKYH